MEIDLSYVTLISKNDAMRFMLERQESDIEQFLYFNALSLQVALEDIGKVLNHPVEDIELDGEIIQNIASYVVLLQESHDHGKRLLAEIQQNFTHLSRI